MHTTGLVQEEGIGICRSLDEDGTSFPIKQNPSSAAGPLPQNRTINSFNNN